MNYIASSEAAIDAAEPLLSPHLSYALQPIVDCQTGTVYAYEALVRGTDLAGYPSIERFFDRAAETGRIWETELALQELALATFRRTPHADRCKLFMNVDNRIFQSRDYDPHKIMLNAAQLGVPPSSVTIELTERHALGTSGNAVDLALQLRRSGMRIALDDFGQGFSELKLLHDAAPEYVKIDRFYIHAIDSSPRKRLFVSTIVNLAHILGSRVIAEGVETEAEFVICRDIGCDLVQGWYIARPYREMDGLPGLYMLPGRDGAVGRRADSPRFRVEDIDPLVPVPIDASMASIFEYFRSSPELNAFPVIDRNDEPLGLIRERELRTYVYSQFGSELLTNRKLPRNLSDFLVRVPIVEIGSRVEDVLASLASREAADGVIVTEGHRYKGFVSSQALLSLMNEHRLSAAMDQNPLSHLPGNASINSHVMTLSGRTAQERHFCYFDFNHFKPFNDTYGYRLGDRAIVLFADILQRHFEPFGAFLGHIGGDDFFAAMSGMSEREFETTVRSVLEDFREQIVSFYAPDDRANRYLVAEDREGRQQMFPLMTCSAALFILPRGAEISALDQFSRDTAAGKRAAKIAQDGVSRLVIG